MTSAARKGSPNGPSNDRERRDVTINLRASTRARDLIDAAASATGKSRSEFILDSARAKAEDVLLDQRLFVLDDAQFERFTAILDSPAPPGERLRALMEKPAPWER